MRTTCFVSSEYKMMSGHLAVIAIWVGKTNCFPRSVCSFQSCAEKRIPTLVEDCFEDFFPWPGLQYAMKVTFFLLGFWDLFDFFLKDSDNSFQHVVVTPCVPALS